MNDRDPDDTSPPTHQPYGQDPYGQAPSGQDPSGPPPAAPPPPYGQNPYGQAPQQQGYPQPGPGYPGQVAGPPNHPSANTALVLGIVALAGGLLLCGLPLVAGPFAWYLGRKVTNEIDANPQQYGGRSEASAGMVLGIVSTVLLGLGVLAVVGFVALLVVGASV